MCITHKTSGNYVQSGVVATCYATYVHQHMVFGYKELRSSYTLIRISY